MANICTNKVVVIGPSEAVKRFVEAARGPVCEASYGAFRTELGIIEQVRNGAPVNQAFREANLRLDALSHRLTSLPLQYELSGRALLPAVSGEDFEAWARQIEESAANYPVNPDGRKETCLSFVRLLPMPQEYLAESYHLAGHNWLLSERGPKWMDAVGEPEFLDAGSVTDKLGELGDSTAIAVYPLFATANSPVFPGLLNVSRSFPDLTFLSAFMEPHESDFRYFAAQNGQEIASQAIQAGDDLPASCKVEFAEDEDNSYFDETLTLAYLIEMAAIEADDRPVPGNHA